MNSVSQSQFDPITAGSYEVTATEAKVSDQIQLRTTSATRTLSHSQGDLPPVSLLPGPNGRTNAAKLPPLYLLIDAPGKVEDLPDRSIGRRSARGHSITGRSKGFLTNETTLWGLDNGFVDNDLQIIRNAAVETDHELRYRRVPYHIPRGLVPLPDILREKPVNLLYYHHFMNHTARTLITHDCPSNPFKMILPKSKSKHHLLYILILLVQ